VPDLFDAIEKEVIDEYGGLLAYSLSLSVKPTHPVTVAISPDIRSLSCYGYEPKFTLETNEFTFTSETYNISQTVTIVVNNLNASKYEGAFSASFQHAITTEDKEFNSAFLRPVSVSLQDDSPCVDGAGTYDATHTGGSRLRKCGCTAGFYIEDADPLYCDSVTKCEACPDGMVCGKQQDFTLAILNETFYRIDATSLNVVKCPDPATQCVGNATHVRLPTCSFLIAALYRHFPLVSAFCASLPPCFYRVLHLVFPPFCRTLSRVVSLLCHKLLPSLSPYPHLTTPTPSAKGDDLCKVGHSGAFCMVCVLEGKRYVRSGDACVLCGGSSEATIYIAVCVLVILCIAAIAFLSWKGSPSNDGWSERVGAFGEKTQTKYKILVTFTQVS
jgi:hypothetical protein